ncbi:MAG: NUDIX domain-containing protein [Patescibacteria group bacterium]|nr:NUDIX domain-containing protein [Patescibacteria group bacterium]
MEQTQKDQVEKAGAIVLHHDDSARVALIYRAKEKDWSFPKGHIEAGETPVAACIREVEEETGLKVDVLAQLPDNAYLHKTGKKIVTHMYLVRSKGKVSFRHFFPPYPQWSSQSDSNIYQSLPTGYPGRINNRKLRSNPYL